METFLETLELQFHECNPPKPPPPQNQPPPKKNPQPPQPPQKTPKFFHSNIFTDCVKEIRIKSQIKVCPVLMNQSTERWKSD